MSKHTHYSINTSWLVCLVKGENNLLGLNEMVNTIMVIIIFVIYQLPTRYASLFTYIIFILYKNPKKIIYFTILQVKKAIHRKLSAGTRIQVNIYTNSYLGRALVTVIIWLLYLCTVGRIKRVVAIKHQYNTCWFHHWNTTWIWKDRYSKLSKIYLIPELG